MSAPTESDVAAVKHRVLQCLLRVRSSEVSGVTQVHICRSRRTTNKHAPVQALLRRHVASRCRRERWHTNKQNNNGLSNVASPTVTTKLYSRSEATVNSLKTRSSKNKTTAFRTNIGGTKKRDTLLYCEPAEAGIVGAEGRVK